MFEDAENIADMFRGGLPYILLAVPILIICSSSPVSASSEFSVHRMAQFDVNGVHFGCRSSALSLEAKSLHSWSTSRHCVLAKFEDMAPHHFMEIKRFAGGLVLLLPKDVASMSREEKERLTYCEQRFMSEAVTIPVYFAAYDAKLQDIIEDIAKMDTKKDDDPTNPSEQTMQQRGSALSEIFNSIAGNGYQIIVTGASHAHNKNSKIPIIQGELVSKKVKKAAEGITDANTALPIIIVAAHLSTFAIYNDYPLNADAAVLLTLADVFSKLRNTQNAALKYRILFLLTESGPLLNYQGAKKWLDENVQLQNVEFVLCIDSITQSINADRHKNIYVHVSKPPKLNSPIYYFLKYLKDAANKFGNTTAETVHKKINLAYSFLAWHHERFSIKRLLSFSLSSLESPAYYTRLSIFRDNDDVILESTHRNAKIIAEALARYVYTNPGDEDIEDFEIFSREMELTPEIVKSYMNVKSSLVNNDLKNAFEKYLKNVKIIYDKPDVREPDFMLYEGAVATLNVHRVKPAVFDLFLSIIICGYLYLVYLFFQYFPNIYQFMCRMSHETQQPSPAHNDCIERNKPKKY